MEKMKHKYVMDVGWQIIITIDGDSRIFIAEVTRSEPSTQLKIQENGPYAHIKSDEFIIKEYYSSLWQGGQDSANKLLRVARDEGRPIYTGLKSLGVNDDELHEAWPDENA